MRYLSFFLFWICATKSFAQIKPDDKDWISYELTWGYWQNAPDEIEFNWRTNHHALSITSDVKIAGPLHLGYGLTYNSENYHTNLRIETTPNGDNVFSLIPDTTRFNYNKINAKYLEVPIELRLQSKPNEYGKFWRLVVGARGGFRFKGYTVFKDGNYKVRYEKLVDLNKFKLGTFVRIGYDWFNIYGYYSLISLFDNGVVEGVPLENTHSINIGISITP